MREKAPTAERSRYRPGTEYIATLQGEQVLVQAMSLDDRILAQYATIGGIDQLGYGEVDPFYWAGEPTEHVVRDHDLPRAATAILRLAVEGLIGRRPASQLAPLLPRHLLQYIQIRGAQLRGGSGEGQGRLLRCHTAQPSEGIGEVCGLATIGSRRPRAVAARLELAPAGWRMTSLVAL